MPKVTIRCHIHLQPYDAGPNWTPTELTVTLEKLTGLRRRIRISTPQANLVLPDELNFKTGTATRNSVLVSSGAWVGEVAWDLPNIVLSGPTKPWWSELAVYSGVGLNSIKKYSLNAQHHHGGLQLLVWHKAQWNDIPREVRACQ
jgi:hypothetical protein